MALPGAALADTGTQDLSAYVKGRAADADGAVTRAAADYATAFAGASDNQLVALRTYREALEAGDYDLADRAAAALRAAGTAPADTDLFALARAIAKSDSHAIDATLDRMNDTPLGFLVPEIRAWQAFDHGDRDAVKLLAGAAENPVSRRYAAENRALLLIATGKYDDGVAALRAMLGADQASFDLRVNAAQLLAGKGQHQLAEALLSGDDPVLAAMRDHLGDGVKPGLAFGASRLFTRLAADLGHGDPTPLTLVLSRSALLMEPTNDRARLLLAQALAGDDADDLALATLAAIGDDSPYFAVARTARITVLDHAGRDQEALAAAKALADAPDAGSDAFQIYGDELVGVERYADAATAYARAIQLAGNDADWSMYLQQGGALEQAGDWAAARPLLEKAVQMAPDEPLALNYLGYADIEHGENVAAAFKLLEKARSLKPGDPAITDSLAWAYFQMGEVAKALPLFEQAVQGQPADETINEHLGDAYWKSGRYYEARYAWRAAAVYADGAAATRLQEKIADGLRPGRVTN